MERQAGNAVANILLVEDDDDLAELVQIHLKFQGHRVSRVTTIADAKAQYQQQPFDLLVLDRGLPDGDGLDICHALRQQQDWSPVLILTAQDGEMDKVEGLEAGVDDYITKPFSVLEFQARVRNVLRRLNQTVDAKVENEAAPVSMTFGALKILPELHQVSLNNREIALTATEFTLLQFLATRPGRVYSKDELLDYVWHTDHSGYHHTVCSTINRLRRKLSLSDSQHHFIQTVWGVGYKFQPQQ
ncbi:response regulator transcription factor [Vibrio hepatarius]|uniref:response regulator transcription factor n=1 Tax=Vibrio hepatarius TaxID=171383 RepID=UPI00142E2287|nr:response regulator transcription factor [Vibrio hepatarius]NIY82341.1 response regulator transcription factor [Vibrio hepatarius]